MIELLAIQDPPPYVQYAEEASSLARMGIAAGICDGIDYEVDRRAGEAAIAALERRAVIDGVGVQWVRRAFQAAMEEEIAGFQTITKRVGDDLWSDESLAIRRDMAEYYAVRCEEAARRWPSVVSASGDEPVTFGDIDERILVGPDYLERRSERSIESPQE